MEIRNKFDALTAEIPNDYSPIHVNCMLNYAAANGFGQLTVAFGWVESVKVSSTPFRMNEYMDVNHGRQAGRQQQQMSNELVHHFITQSN